MAEKLRILEVGARDGLQNDPTPVSTADKVRMIEALAACGLTYQELTSFVSPKAVPQMADAAEVVAKTGSLTNGEFLCVVINEKGYDRALEAGASGISMVVMSTETFSQKNNRMSVRETIDVVKKMLTRAKEDGLTARMYISAAWVCPYEGEVAPDTVLRITDELWQHGGFSELAISDTIGHASPAKVKSLFLDMAKRYDIAKLAAHLHDTQALGMANATAAIEAGVRIIDSSIGGLGGCPFAPGAAGNLATEDLVLLAHKLGFETGVDLDGLYQALLLSEEIVKHPIGGRIRKWWESDRARTQ